MEPAIAQNLTQPPTVQPAPNPILEAEQRAADDIVRLLCDARDRSQVLENLRVELMFPDIQEGHRGSSSSAKGRSSRSVSVQFLQRTTVKKRKCLTLEIGASSSLPRLRLRVDLKPQRETEKPADISVQLVAKCIPGGAENGEEVLLTNSYVSMQFKLNSGGAEQAEFSDDQPLALNNVQNLGSMLAGLQDVWFTARERKDAPDNVAFREHDLSLYWVQGEERWSTWQPDFSEISSPIEREQEAGRFLAALIIWRCIAALYVGDNNKVSLRRQAGLPDPDEFFPNRPVDLIPDVVREHLERQKLRVPWHVIEAACKSLNAGKHVIFTGPPGCGKTELAAELASLATGGKRDGLVVTASPQWSSAELIGRYVPKRLIYGLDFAPGFFLRAIEQRRWLVIDEFNRAPIDACFGELFTVLSGQTVELPFEEESPNGTVGRVRVIPAIRTGTILSAGGSERPYRDYAVPADFRIIGTMNDADRSDLNRLSFALLRRFDVIRVDAPNATTLKAIIQDAMEVSRGTAELEQRGYTFRGFHASASKVFDDLFEVFVQLFVGDQRKKAAALDGLVADRIVGVATCRDVITFVAEGMRAPLPAGAFEDSRRRCGCQRVDDSNEKYDPADLARSYLAMALVLKAFPQFEGLRSEKRRNVLERLIRVFDGCPFLRVEPVDGDSEVRFEIAAVDAPREADLDGDGSLSIGEYLVEEIRCQVRGTTDEQDYVELLTKSQ